ncbi:unnamed protein product [Adineta steineri]|uniref:C2 domain-containing protein n=1 Tax=Adineta steineri TaxID=433720 RepID=A0A818REF1_9BILA|nr:unnamed protein product [Adineta steineri]
MFNSKKNNKPTKRSKGEGGGSALMQQMGFQIPNFDDPNLGAPDDDDDDDTLLDELREMQQDTGGHASKRTKPNQKKPSGSTKDLQSFHNDVNKLLSDIDRPIDDEELSEGDEDELLDELHEIAGDIETENQMEVEETKPVSSASNGNILSVLEARRGMYVKAVETAKTNGDASKARRLDRQLKLIQELLQSARTGAPINESDIPPELFITAPSSTSQPAVVAQEVPLQVSASSSSSPSLPRQSAVSLPKNDQPAISRPPASVSTSNNSEEEIMRLKSLALQAKTEGDMAKAKEYLIQMKNLQNATTTIPAALPPTSAQKEMPSNVPDNENATAPSLPLTAPEPKTVLEALQQRHEELTKRHQDAVSKGDSSKARRMDRLAKQYQEAIDATRKGRPYDYSELADLPGFAPIPVPQSKAQQPPPTANPTVAPVKTSQSTTQVRPTQPQPQRISQPPGPMLQPTPTTSTNTQRDQQVQAYRLKQEQYQKLAVQAKQKGDLETAKKYLLAYKDIERTIASTESDVPMETNEVPEVPSGGYEMIQDDELTEDLAQADRDTIYRHLQEDLLRQMQLCARNQQMYAQMEGPNNAKQANDFKILEQRCAHDLERLRQCFQHGLKAPLFHYEKRHMNIILVNNDLTDNDLEVNVLRGINLHVPAGYSATALETYVIIEFPYPPETPQTARTRHATGTTNAEYADSLHKFQIKRNDNKFKRLMTRKELKLTIFYKAGFLRSDRQLGTASIKLAALDQTSTIHESADVFENDHKKKAEGKLEVKIRIKEPFGQVKSSELSTQRWLVIDRFEDISHTTKPSTSKFPSTASPITAISRLVPTGEALGLLAINLAGNNNNNKNDDIVDSRRSSGVELKNDNRRESQIQTGTQSIQVLKYEADLLHDQIEQLEDHLTPDQIDKLRLKHQALIDESDRIVQSLRDGGKPALQKHVQYLEGLIEQYDKESQEHRQRNDIKKADLFLNKKNLVTKEIETLTGQPPPSTSSDTEF